MTAVVFIAYQNKLTQGERYCNSEIIDGMAINNNLCCWFYFRNDNNTLIVLILLVKLLFILEGNFHWNVEVISAKILVVLLTLPPIL